ncbi:MAG: hypothetical protein LBD52_07970 [Prevotellaceae bacterium]|jgi:hypothetical protein|nr:hypothetical protein [Prevotellaceae bacterium]
MPTTTEVPPREAMLKHLTGKSVVKEQVYDATLDVFNQIKEILHELCNDVNEVLPENQNRRVRLEYRDRGKFEAEIKVAGDVLIFSMHSNVFQFDRNHPVWKTAYVQKGPYHSYCGIISVYNFLSDSFKYNRNDDLGYLIGRLFINRDKSFFVEGKRQEAFGYRRFGEKVITPSDLVLIIEAAVLYAIEFDLLAPPYELVKLATVEQMNAKIENAKIQTGKRVGFQFRSDDVLDVLE